MDVPFILFHFLVDEAHLSVVPFVHMFKTISQWKNMKAYGAL
jgi:hypothetical protein